MVYNTEKPQRYSLSDKNTQTHVVTFYSTHIWVKTNIQEKFGHFIQKLDSQFIHISPSQGALILNWTMEILSYLFKKSY